MAEPAGHKPRDLLRIASYNVHRCIGTDLRRDVDRVARVIRELDCDTVGLQEVDNRAGAGSDSMQLEFLARATAMTPIAGPTIIHHEGHYGNALLTIREIVAVRQHDLSIDGHEPRGVLDVDLRVAGRIVRVLVTHLGLRPAERRLQVRKLLDLLAETPYDEPAIVLGDINEWLPLGRPLRWLHGLLGKPPWERSYPTWMPLFALDRVWVRPRQAMLSFEVHRSPTARKASDHFPVRAVIAADELHGVGRES